MQITCFVNQTEAIRRGHDTNSTVKLDVNPANLSQEQRDTLAAKFNNGSYNNHSHYLKEPTLEGLMESLDAVATATKEEAAEKAKVLQEAWGKFDTDPRSMMWFSICPDIARLNSPLKDAEITSERKVVFESIQAAMISERCEKREEEKKAQELAVKERELRKAAQETTTANFRKWALEHGSTTLCMRVTEGFDWTGLAAEEWVSKLLSTAGIPVDNEVVEWAGYEADVGAVTAPSLSVMQALRTFREALLKELPADKFELSLHAVTYTEGDAYYEEAKVVKQTELKAYINTPNGGGITKFYKIE